LSAAEQPLEGTRVALADPSVAEEIVGVVAFTE
jgi:hypothetical protein